MDKPHTLPDLPNNPDEKAERIERLTGGTIKLTAAETKVLNLVSCAMSNKEIAAVLKISPATVKRHLENIFRKACLRNRVEAAIYGLYVTGWPRAFSENSLLKTWRSTRWTSPAMCHLTNRRIARVCASNDRKSTRRM
jgi:DNA-binding CsgD family transcriptional regulator